MEFHRRRDGEDGNRRNRYRYFTTEQTRRMEASFKQDSHPNEGQRLILSDELGLDPLRIKFWFQNKRNQEKRQNEIQLNKNLKEENKMLIIQNITLKVEMRSASCNSCGNPLIPGENSSNTNKLWIENAQLRNKIMKASTLLSLRGGESVVSNLASSMVISSGKQPADMIIESNKRGKVVTQYEFTRSLTEILKDRSNMFRLATNAMEEILALAQIGEPLWLSNTNSSLKILNREEYFWKFGKIRATNLKMEGTREECEIFMSANSLIEIFMDVDKWSNVFSTIVSNHAMVLDVLSSGEETHDGTLILVSAEYQFPSPLVPTRECIFLRFCKKISDSCWAIVDFSLDSTDPCDARKCLRKPSGCIIETLSFEYLKVIWIENVEVDNSYVHNRYNSLVDSGLAFGARRWVVTLKQQCDRLRIIKEIDVDTSVDDDDAMRTNIKKKSILKVAERMVVNFFSSVTGSSTQNCIVVSDMSIGNVRLVIRKTANDPTRPSSTVLSASTSFWLPFHPKRVYNILRDEATYGKVGILMNDVNAKKMDQIVVGKETEDSVSLLHLRDVNSKEISNKVIIILQESFFDVTSSYVVFAPVMEKDMNRLMNGVDSDEVHLLPSGFAVAADGPSLNPGSLVTVSFQIIMDSNIQADLPHDTVALIENLVLHAEKNIKDVMLNDDHNV